MESLSLEGFKGLGDMVSAGQWLDWMVSEKESLILSLGLAWAGKSSVSCAWEAGVAAGAVAGGEAGAAPSSPGRLRAPGSAGDGARTRFLLCRESQEQPRLLRLAPEGTGRILGGGARSVSDVWMRIGFGTEQHPPPSHLSPVPSPEFRLTFAGKGGRGEFCALHMHE